MKILSTPSFEGEVKPVAPCHKFLRHIEEHFEVWTEILRKVKFIIPFALPPVCYQMTAGRIARELWWTNQKFSSVDIIPPWFYMLLYHLGGWKIGPVVVAVQRRSLTPSTPSSSSRLHSGHSVSSASGTALLLNLKQDVVHFNRSAFSMYTNIGFVAQTDSTELITV
jgi:hypothetical protein